MSKRFSARRINRSRECHAFASLPLSELMEFVSVHQMLKLRKENVFVVRVSQIGAMFVKQIVLLCRLGMVVNVCVSLG